MAEAFECAGLQEVKGARVSREIFQSIVDQLKLNVLHVMYDDDDYVVASLARS